MCDNSQWTLFGCGFFPFVNFRNDCLRQLRIIFVLFFF